MMLLLLGILYVQNRDLHEKIYAETMEYHKSQIYALMQMAKTYVDGEMQSSEARLKRELISQVDLAWSMVESTERTHRDLPRDQLVKLIAENLRQLRYRNGAGYYFMTGYDSIEILYPPNPKYEGTKLFWQDSATRSALAAQYQMGLSQGSGFNHYMWTKPGESGHTHAKISYVRAHPRLKFILGTGLYESYMTPQIQSDVLNQLAKLNLGKDGYFFATDWDGVVQLGPAKGKNMLHVKDEDGLPVVQRLIQLSKSGGGFLEYFMPTEVSNGRIHKLSYVLGIPEWHWYIGIGRDIENMEKMIQVREAEMLRQSLWIIGLAVTIGFFLLLISSWISRRMSRQFGNDLGQFIEYYQNSGLSLEPLPVDKIQYLELKKVAIEANAMVYQLRKLASENAHTLRILQEKNEELEQVLFIAGHDLRTPLVTLQGFASELDLDCNAAVNTQIESVRDEALRNNIPQANAYIQKAALRMETLIQGISRYGRLGRIQPEPVNISMFSLFDECLHGMNMLLRKASVQVDLEHAPGCYGDPMLVTQICTNIIENAVKYSEPERPLQIHIEGTLADGYALYSIQDNGIGIAAKDLQKIFGIFIRLNQKPDVPGDGMGLAISHRLALKMGGDLLVQSEAGVGSTFVLKMPAQAQPHIDATKVYSN